MCACVHARVFDGDISWSGRRMVLDQALIIQWRACSNVIGWEAGSMIWLKGHYGHVQSTYSLRVDRCIHTHPHAHTCTHTHTQNCPSRQWYKLTPCTNRQDGSKESLNHSRCRCALVIPASQDRCLYGGQSEIHSHLHAHTWLETSTALGGQISKKENSYSLIKLTKWKNLRRSSRLALPSWWGCNPGHVACAWRHGKWPQSWKWHNMVQSGLYCDFSVDLPWSHSELQGPPTGSYNHRLLHCRKPH